MSNIYRKTLKDEHYDKLLKKEEIEKSYKRKCKKCGWDNIMLRHRKVVNTRTCKNCGSLIYLDEKIEFKEKLNKMIKREK